MEITKRNYTMLHSFCPVVAKEFGVNTAIFLQNLAFWTETNLANNKNIHDGYCWTYNTLDAFTNLFPYFTKKMVRVVIDNALKDGLVIKSNYNQIKYDRTVWYALTPKAYLYFNQLVNPKYLNLLGDAFEAICPKGHIEMFERAHRNVEKGTPIPDNKPDTKPYTLSISLPKEEKQKKQKDILSLEDILKDNPYNLTKESLRDWLAVRKTKRLPLTQTAWTKQLNQLKQFEANGCDPREVFIYGVGKGWASIEIGYDGILERFSAINRGHLNPQSQKTKKDVEDDLKRRDEESVARAQKQAEEFLKEKGIDISQTKGFPTGPILKVINK
jgi:hypothetical protein